MRWCLRVKLAHNWSAFADLLLATGDLPIVEHSRKDAFWGAIETGSGTLVGVNALGRLLMELRESVRSGQIEESSPVSPPNIPNFLLVGRAIGEIIPPGYVDSSDKREGGFSR